MTKRRYEPPCPVYSNNRCLHPSPVQTPEKQQKKLVRQAVDAANEEGFPSDPEEVEAYFMQEVARGEQLCQEGADAMDAALCFYRALKVYPQPRELITIYDKTVPKPVLDVLAEMIAVDSSIPIGKQTPAASADGETAETD